MSLMHGLNDSSSLVHIGNRGDICVLCLRELIAAEKIDQLSARTKLRNNLEGKKVVKIRQSGADVIICLDHIHKIAEENPLHD